MSMYGCRIRIGIVLVLLLGFCPASRATRWTLVDFGSNLTSCVTPYPGWTNILRHPTRTQFVSPDGDPAHDGITITAGLGETDYSYFGIRGTSPIAFRPGHEIICTFYNRTDGYPYPGLRISFTDPDVPDPEEGDFPWYTIYHPDINIDTAYIEPRSLVELRYYIQDESMLAAINGIASTGDHYMVNVSFAVFDADEPPLVLTKIEFSDDADLTPPTQPTDLTAELVALTAGISPNAVKLGWSPSTDPGAHATGISRYYIYRNGELYDIVSKDMTAFLGTNLHYYDSGAAPDTAYTYQVAALDKAQYGLYPRLGRPPCHPANRSELSVPVTVTTPVWQSSTLLNPWVDLEYAGGFRLPLEGETWSYASAGLTWYPGGNPAHGANELSGSLYALSHTLRGAGSFSIPLPVLSANLDDWPRAATIIPANTNIWPRVYDGQTVPAGGGEFGVGDILYHPGGNGITGRLYYAICNFYATDPEAPSHGWFDLALTEGHGAWHIGGVPPDNVCPSLTTRYMCRIPQAWADAHTGGRSLLTGNNLLSGGPEINNGPNIYAVSPWASGVLPANGDALPATLMLQSESPRPLVAPRPDRRVGRLIKRAGCYLLTRASRRLRKMSMTCP